LDSLSSKEVVSKWLNHLKINVVTKKSFTMKNKEKKELEGKLLAAIEKVIRDNKAHLSRKIERNLKKSIKQIVKKTDKKRSAIPSKRIR
jgi:hypothetical protein